MLYRIEKDRNAHPSVASTVATGHNRTLATLGSDMTVRKRGKRFEAQVRIREDGVLVHSETKTFDTKQQATRWKLNTQEEIRNAGWRERVESGVTVKDLMVKYNDMRERSRGFQHSLGVVLGSELGGLSLKRLTSADVVQFAMKLQAAGQAPATVMHHLATLRAAVNAAKDLFGLDADKDVMVAAVRQLKLLRVAGPSTRRDNRVTDADLAVILPEFESDQAVIPMAMIVRLAIALPRRREELLSMRRENLAQDGSTIKLIDTKDPRKYREEVVPVPPAALALLRSIPGSDPVFLPYKPESVSARWQRAVRRVSLPHLRFHDLRHEGISRLFEAGLSIEEVALISGHTSWATLRRYTHLQPQAVTEKLRRKA